MLVDPGLPAAIVLGVVQRLGHVEVDLGVLEVAGEDRVHAPRPLHARQLVAGAEVLEQGGGRGQLGPGVLVAARQTGDLGPHGSGAGQTAAIALRLGLVDDGLQVGLRLRELAQLDPGRRPRQHERPTRRAVELAVADRGPPAPPARWPAAGRGGRRRGWPTPAAPAPPRRPCRGGRPAAARPSSPASSAAVAQWWARTSGRPALCPSSTIALATPTWRRARSAFVMVWYATSRTLAERNRHHPPSTSSRPGVGERVEHRAAGVLAEGLAELDQRAVRARRPEHGGVVEHGPLVGGQLVEPGGDERAERVGQLQRLAAAAHQLGQLLQEQRVAAAAFVELVGERVGGLVAQHGPEQLAGRLRSSGLQAQRQRA